MNEEIEINGVSYVPKSTVVDQMAADAEGLEYVIVRADRAGVFAGYLESKDGQEVTLVNTRRLWYWDGAASISQLAIDGTSKPENCKFPEAVKKILIQGVIEIIPATEKARCSIEGVKIWQS